MLILGIDPGTATTGYGFVDFREPDLQVVEYGLIETGKNGKPEKRLEKIHSLLLAQLYEKKPDIVAIEKLFFARNVKTAMRVSQSVGVMLYTIAQAQIPVVEYAPGRIKKLVSGNGRSNKEEMQTAVRVYLGPAVRKKKGEKTHFDNAADALAVAICHLKHNGLLKNDIIS